VTRTDFDPGAEAAAATDAILRDTVGGSHRGVVVDSPPGAGKSTLVVRAARELAAATTWRTGWRQPTPSCPSGGCTARTRRRTRSSTGTPPC
jgi:Mrp family chromosome partitioning ATPase